MANLVNGQDPQLTTIDTVVDRIEADTTSIETKVDTVDTVVDRIEVDTTSIETKVDTVNTNAGLVKTNLLSADKVYPTMAAGVTVTADAAAWTLGNYAEVVPVNTITSNFVINQINMGAVSAATYYELVLYAATTEVGRIRFYTSDAAYGYAFKGFHTPVIAANSQIQAKLATASAEADTCVISISYTLSV